MRRESLVRLAREQAALRRVATLIAQRRPRNEVTKVVSTEIGRLLGADATGIARYEGGGMATALGSWSREGEFPVATGTRFALGRGTAGARVLETGLPARIESYAGAEGAAAESAREQGWQSSIGVPIVAAGRPWGFAIIGTKGDRPLPADTEARVASFMELMAMAIASSQARLEVTRLAAEQAALRRVATLVAQGNPAEVVFEAVAREIAHVLDVPMVTIDCYNGHESSTVLASLDPSFPVGTTWPLDGPSLGAAVLQTGRSARIDDYGGLPGVVAAEVRKSPAHAAIGVPIVVDGAVWGVLCVSSPEPEFPPDETEGRLAAFSELLETAISNAQSRGDLIASRARIAAAADEARKRIDHDLRGGVQHQLVEVKGEVDAVCSAIPAEFAKVEGMLTSISEGLTSVVAELGDIAHGIHPAVLSDSGLEPALSGLSSRSAVPVTLDFAAMPRLPERVEVAAYYVVSEALTNAAKHAHASFVNVAADVSEAQLRLAIRDDGIGGANARGGSGLVGMRDRVEALGGTLEISSPGGGGTTLVVALPLAAGRGAGGVR